ncbi:hypothetical protein [Providencia rustigianii]|uniref:Uncharacterized protein n=1 Tax=Providencia rustigianii DSM 4541 TaxID=500637 RepID=D1P803_9GAMM|nr:hypothetical protein [Providencia rustigianii]EFB70446.1 hypothetical protein PROVRUST_08384 [Providencia rustigianii DSM 4541]MBP6436063.1 hypothetical protein [Paludibacteraceae bacterium]SUD70737.1 Uncharacterised protein [Providencia rustigianii]
MSQLKIHVTLQLPDDLNAWVNFKSQSEKRSKRNFLMLLIEQAREIDLASRELKKQAEQNND